MGKVFYNLNHCSSLDGMAPQAAAGGGFTNAALPAGLSGPGIYLIYNGSENNRYVGISTELTTRFNTRMGVVTELGLPSATMQAIYVMWGAVSTRNNGAIAMMPLPGYLGPLTANIDGTNFNLEHLLIRYFKIVAGFGGTISNNVYANTPFTNSTPHPLEVQLDWAGGVGNLVAGTMTHTLAAGATW